MKTSDFEPRTAWKNAVDPIATGKAWRQKRKELHLSQDDLSLIFELAEMGINMSKAAISAVENGKHKPSLDHVIFFAALCACPVEELVVTCGRSREADDRDQLPPFNFIYNILDEHLQMQMFVFFVNLRLMENVQKVLIMEL